MAIKTIQELLEMKESIENRKNEIKTFYVESLDTYFEYKLATRAEMVNIRQMDLADMDPMLVFKHVLKPILNDPQLQEVYNKGYKPYEIVDKLLLPDEVIELALAIMDKTAKINMAKEIKNS